MKNKKMFLGINFLQKLILLIVFLTSFFVVSTGKGPTANGHEMREIILGVKFGTLCAGVIVSSCFTLLLYLAFWLYHGHGRK